MKLCWCVTCADEIDIRAGCASGKDGNGVKRTRVNRGQRGQKGVGV